MSENKKTKKEESKKDEQEEVPFVLPPLEFSSLVLPFFTQGLLSLGQIKEEEEKEEEKEDTQHLSLAKRIIELLDLFRERTKGNLKPEEEKFIESSIHQLKLSYMEKAKIIKL
jgi:hypothetical protein